MKTTYIGRLVTRTKRFINYCIKGVWNDPRQTMYVRLVKTLNLSINSFLDRNLQLRAMALTYSMVLALVPAVALLVAIGRGFGLQNTLMQELYHFFPSQHRMIETTLDFVDSYLNEATQGIFVGVGIVILLWTVVSLLSYIEEAFNSIWNIRNERPIYQKVTDYIAICLIIPVLMICSSGVSIFMSTTIQNNLVFPFLTPVVNTALEAAPIVLAWMALTFSFFFIPNTKVSFKYAAISGAICAVGFSILQILFVNGQIYVSKYNAIYGSFAFIPLFLIWLQLTWMLVLAGCLLTYSLQNVFTFNFMGDENQISITGWHAISLITMCVIVDRFLKKKEPLTCAEIASRYNLPIRLVNKVTEMLYNAKLIYYVKTKSQITALTPALEVDNLSVGEFYRLFDTAGQEDVIPDYEEIYHDMLALLRPIAERSYSDYDAVLLKDIPLPTPGQIHDILLNRVIS